jgi:hypothetical protein
MHPLGNKKVEPACKPGSVEDSHSSRAYVAVRLKRPTREQRGPRLMLPYLVLLRVGFTLPPVLPQARCALTAPFHPYRRRERRLAVYFLWHWPWAYAPQALPGTLPYGARTFLHARKDTAAVQPAQVQFNTAGGESPKHRDGRYYCRRGDRIIRVTTRQPCTASMPHPRQASPNQMSVKTFP